MYLCSLIKVKLLLIIIMAYPYYQGPKNISDFMKITYSLILAFLTKNTNFAIFPKFHLFFLISKHFLRFLKSRIEKMQIIFQIWSIFEFEFHL